MEEQIRCPKCKGDKFKILSSGMLKCEYCGTIFSPTVKKEENTSKEQQPKQVIVNVQQKPTSQDRYYDQLMLEKEQKLKNNRFAAIGFVILLIIFVILGLLGVPLL